MPDFDHADLLLGGVVVERGPQIDREAQVVVDAVTHPAGQRGDFSAGLGCVVVMVLDRYEGGLAEQAGLLGEQAGVDPAYRVGTGGVRCGLEPQERVGRLQGHTARGASSAAAVSSRSRCAQHNWCPAGV